VQGSKSLIHKIWWCPGGKSGGGFGANTERLTGRQMIVHQSADVLNKSKLAYVFRHTNLFMSFNMRSNGV